MKRYGVMMKKKKYTSGLINFIKKHGTGVGEPKWNFALSEKEFDDFLINGPAQYGSQPEFFFFRGKHYSHDPMFFKKIGINPILKKTPIGDFWTYNTPMFDEMIGD
ncbi:MAG: hypothetical protein LUQ65_11655 [Candidatus Helarchaeota archaeon]|nr:hypothetical protein [Candidatus Helarchaeota archaeon]